MKRILVLKGGGARIVMLLAALVVLEKATGKKTYQLFDLLIGTSSGSIVAVMLGTGMLSAKEVLTITKKVLPKVFKRNSNRKHKYTKDALRDAFRKLFRDYAFGDMKTKVIVTSYEDCEPRMHFFKSWEPLDGAMTIFKPVDRSSAAPLYFGPIADEEEGKVWLDGGVGIYNNPVLYASVEVLRQGWDEKDVHCICLGTGRRDISRQFKDAANDGKIAQIVNMLLRGTGIARSTADAALCNSLSQRPWKFADIDTTIPKKMDKMDGIKYFDKYIEYGTKQGEVLETEYNSVR